MQLHISKKLLEMLRHSVSADVGIGRLIVIYTIGKYKFLFLLPKVDKQHDSGFVSCISGCVV